jgi:microcystin-dependent protein
MAALTPTAKMQFFKADGTPLVGGKLYTYTAGTTTPQTTFTDSSGGTANTNPVILDSRGEANIWLGGSTYKFKLADANDVEIWTVDNISAPTSGVSPALSGNVTIDTNSSSPALKITQTGTGYALRVQDSADPDSTPLVIDNTGKLGLGTTSPSEALDIDNSGKIQFSASGAARMIISCDASNSIFDVSGARNYVVKTNSTTILTGNTTSLTSTVPVVLPGSPTTSLQAATKTYVDTEITTSAAATRVPAGAITAFAASSPPSGWLTCDGSAVSRTTYAALFAVLGSTWGAGDGSTTFNVPDLRGQFLRGFDSRATATSQDTTFVSGITTNTSTTISGINSTTYLYAGMPISGTGIPAGATISSVAANSIVISAAATASSATIGTGATTNGSSVVTVSSTSTLSVGQAISGTNIPTGSYIINIFNATTVNISANATGTNTGLTFTLGTSLTVGRTFASAQADAYKNHDHGVRDPTHTHTYTSCSASLAGAAAGAGQPSPGQTTTASATGVTVNNSHTGNTETRPKNYAVLYIIKT